MKQSIFLGWVMLLIVAIGPGCKKKKDGGCSEAKMEVTTDPAEGSVQAPSVGPNFPVKITLASGMPSSGVSIQVKARPEGPTSTPFFDTLMKNVMTPSTDLTIKGTPAGSAAVVDITVTSSTCNTNRWTGSYRYSRK